MHGHVTFLVMTSSVAAPRWSAGQWALLFVLCGAICLDSLDISMVGMALPSIRTDLGLSTSSLQWIVSGYVLGYGGLLLLGGRAADLLGRRRVLLIGLAAFALASLLGGLVSDGSMLIAARFIKGVAAAFTAPAGLSIITTTFAEGPARNRALAIYTTCGASGFSMGLILGGILTEAGWRWTFLLPAPVALAIFIAGRFVIPADSGARVRSSYDIAGAVTATASMLLLVYAVVRAPEVGWTSVQTIGSLVAVIVLGTAFVLAELRSRHPLVRLGILRSGSLRRANLGALTVFGAYVGFQFVGTLYMQSLLGWSSLRTAFAFLPAGLIVALTAPWVGKLADRFGTARILVVGATSFVAGYLLSLRINESPNYATIVLPTMLLIGLGFALSFPSLNIQATNGVADEEQGLASGLLNTSFQVGGAIGLAVVTAVVSAAGNANAGASAASALDSFHPALAVVGGIAALGLLVAVTGVIANRRDAARAGVVEPESDAPIADVEPLPEPVGAIAD
jgi:EmrB/QacA subfamily drug resistance transporter